MYFDFFLRSINFIQQKWLKINYFIFEYFLLYKNFISLIVRKHQNQSIFYLKTSKPNTYPKKLKFNHPLLTSNNYDPFKFNSVFIWFIIKTQIF